MPVAAAVHGPELWSNRDLIHELGAEFAADPPGQAALPRVSRRQNNGEFGRDFRIFRNHFDPTRRDVGDHAIARQVAGSKLDLGDPAAFTTLGLPPIDEHFPHPLVGLLHNEPQPIAVMCWNPPSGTTCIIAIALGFHLRPQTVRRLSRQVPKLRFAEIPAALQAHRWG